MEMRWDAVVQNSDFWSESRQSPAASVADAERPVRVRIRLFGSLNDGAVRSPVTLELRGPFSVADVIAGLGRLHGRAFLDRVTDPAGGLLRNCRAFVNGQPVDEAAAPIRAAGQQTEFELILLTAVEGG